MTEEKSKKPANTRFKQQKLPAWRPILTPEAVIIAFTVVGVIFAIIGATVYTYSAKVVEVYSDDYVQDVAKGGCCESGCDGVRSNDRTDMNPCFVTLNITKDMEPPIYMYYKLTRFYQNHRMYVKSRDDPQLAGSTGLTPSELEANCKVGDKNTIGWAADFDPSNPGDNDTVEHSVSPCGLIAFSMFNDSFLLEQKVDGQWTAVEKQSPKGISWESDRDMKFHNAEDGSSGNNFPGFHREKTLGCDELPDTGASPSAEVRRKCMEAKEKALRRSGGMDPGWCFKDSGYCIEDEHFIVWMRTAGLPSFRKLYAKIDQTLHADTEYRVRVWNGFDHSPYAATGADGTQNLFPVHTFHGEKFIVLSTTEWIGGRNDFLGIAYIVVGSICLVLALAFCVKWRFARGSDTKA